jgi:tripartite-type tricarboxylate transporter receptor subunit TctC
MAAPAWSGFYGPRGLAEPVLDLLEGAFRKASETEQWKAMCRERGVEPLFLGRADFEAFATEQAAFFAEEIPALVRLAGAEP